MVLLVFHAETTNGFDNWEIIPLKIVHFCPRYRSNALKDEEQSSIAYWRGRGADLLNKNKAIMHGERADYDSMAVAQWSGTHRCERALNV